MDSFEWNKVFAAVLATAFVVLGLNFLSDGLFSSHSPEKPGYEIAGGEAEAATGGEAGAVTIESVNAMLATVDMAAGEKVAKKCAACHTFNEGGANKVGPYLYGVVNRPLASVSDFGYSAGMKEYAPGKNWTYDELNAFLYKPKDHIKGTTMGFAGLKKTEERAVMIGYLRSLAPTMAPLPDPAAAAAPAEAPKASN